MTAAVAEATVLRFHVLASAAEGARRIEGIPTRVLVARDGRERVVIRLCCGDEAAEVRLPLERVERVERLSVRSLAAWQGPAPRGDRAGCAVARVRKRT